MNDIYSTMHKLTANLIETVYPAEDEGKISPVSLKCEITRGNVTYSVTNERDSKGNYESDIIADSSGELDKAKGICPLGKDYEVAIAKFISGYLSRPQTIRDILDGKETADSSIKKAVDIFNN